jgi:hypothetical protein
LEGFGSQIPEGSPLHGQVKEDRPMLQGSSRAWWKVCRFHGARGGAPKGKANAWKHGYYTEAAKAERLLVKLLLKDASNLLKLLSKGEK